jgi:hypothetical protein
MTKEISYQSEEMPNGQQMTVRHAWTSWQGSAHSNEKYI